MEKIKWRKNRQKLKKMSEKFKEKIYEEKFGTNKEEKTK